MEGHLIKQIILEQKEEIKIISLGEIIPRGIQLKVDSPVKSDLIKVLMWVRRYGKSVLAHQLLREKNYGYVELTRARKAGGG